MCFELKHLLPGGELTFNERQHQRELFQIVMGHGK